MKIKLNKKCIGALSRVGNASNEGLGNPQPKHERLNTSSRGHVKPKFGENQVPRSDLHCLICKRSKTRLVRDHNHETGRIRGILCNRCNRNLGIYEACLRYRMNLDLRNKPGYKYWEYYYKEEINDHLDRDTGLDYDYKPGKKLRPSLEEVWERCYGT